MSRVEFVKFFVNLSLSLSLKRGGEKVYKTTLDRSKTHQKWEKGSP
jgi:hypothetical protein